MRCLLLVMMLVIAPGVAFAEGNICKKATCKTTWVEPQTNVDGSNLNDLKEYRVYLATTAAGVAAQTVPMFVIAATLTDPAPGAIVTFTGVRSLAPGQWYEQISAVDTSGNESGRSAVVPFVLQDDVAPLAPSTPTISD